MGTGVRNPKATWPRLLAGPRTAECVAQLLNLLYRRFAIGRRPPRRWPSDSTVRRRRRPVSRLQTCDTADWKSALRGKRPGRSWTIRASDTERAIVPLLAW